MKYDNQLRYAAKIIKEYDGRFPLAAWLKDFFRANKQMGSSDRKTVAELVYGYFRLGANTFNTTEEKILFAVSLSDNLPQLKEYFSSKPAVAAKPDAAANIFPFTHLLSPSIDAQAFSASFLTQPDLFLRIRPGKESIVLKKLHATGTSYEFFDDPCLSLPISTKVDSIAQINKEVVIQDRSSQRAGALLNDISGAVRSVWDCCAASGGKSIMAFDLIKDIQLTVSDIRSSIIVTLEERFRQSGITKYTSFVADLTKANVVLPSVKYDLILADVPCTGSGTWARTPEQLSFFKEDKIDYYVNLQRQIVNRAVQYLKPGGILLYITCSAFEKENEEQVKFICSNHQMKTTKMEVVKGYEHRADTMFAALLTN